MTDWAELAGMWATAGMPGSPLSTIESFADWLEARDTETRKQALRDAEMAIMAEANPDAPDHDPELFKGLIRAAVILQDKAA